MEIVRVQHKHWGNDVKVVKESEKGIQLQIIGDSRFVARVGWKAWFPKSALIVQDGFATVKPWFLPKLNRSQEYVLGFAE